MNADALGILIGALFLVALLILGIWFLVWVYRDANSRGMSGGLWVVIFLLTGWLVGLLIYMLVRKERQACPVGHPLEPGYRFCPICQSTQQVAPRHPQPAVKTERRKTTHDANVQQSKQRPHTQLDDEEEQHDSTAASGLRRWSAQLIMQHGEFPGRVFEVQPRGCTIGRDGGNTIELQDFAISQQHAKIRFRDTSFWIGDIDALNPTQVNGVKLAMNEWKVLRDGDQIEIGHTAFVFRLTDLHSQRSDP